MTTRKQLVVNADDFGFTPDVNEGIVQAHREGILTAATLMANGDAFEDAVALARQTPSLDIGCHLVLIGGRSLISGKQFPETPGALLAAIVRRQISPYREFREQIERIVEAGIQPTHLDTHKHTHLVPAVLEAVARLAEEFAIRWVRRPFDFPMTADHGAVPALKQLTSRVLGFARPRFHRVLEAHHCRTTGHFAGFRITGRLRTPELIALLEALPEGSTELICHPFPCAYPLPRARTRLKESRQAELEALTAPDVREAIERASIELVNYRKLSDGG